VNEKQTDLFLLYSYYIFRKILTRETLEFCNFPFRSFTSDLGEISLKTTAGALVPNPKTSDIHL
jgi:hypothetical protein